MIQRDVWGHYYFKEMLGQGSYGKVYLAKSTQVALVPPDPSLRHKHSQPNPMRGTLGEDNPMKKDPRPGISGPRGAGMMSSSQDPGIAPVLAKENMVAIKILDKCKFKQSEHGVRNLI